MLAESYSNAEIISRFSEKGRKYAKVKMRCDRCGGHGIYAIGVHNGQLAPSPVDHGRCFECNGVGYIIKNVRDYSEAELKSQEAAKERRKQDAEAKRLAGLQERNLKILMRYGFEKPTAYAVLGNSYALRDALKEHGAKFSYELLWVCPTEPTWLEPHQYAAINACDLFEYDTLGNVCLKGHAAEFIQSLQPVVGRHLGNIGSKLLLTVRVEKALAFKTSFMRGGMWPVTTYKYIMKTPDGDTLVWNTSNGYMTEGCSYVIQGTVKEHSEYHKTLNTVLTRCKILEEVTDNEVE
jgi:hypothetical protein